MAYLRTFGTPALSAHAGSPALPLRRKDLALLAYLRAEQGRAFSRTALAALLWGDAPEAKARHSLSQAVSRLQAAVPIGLLCADASAVSLAPGLPSDLDLFTGDAGIDRLLAELPEAPFLGGFVAGPGAEELEDWADRKRSALRAAMVARLDALGAERESVGDAAGALVAGELAVRADPFGERGHRRVMRALAALGERTRALRHHDALAAWLERETGDPPDPATTALADELRVGPAASAGRARAGSMP
jgi:DNA-binding SARP family transcriptional activator